ncbi:MAG: ATP-binding protein [Ktedonobacteraceae bacterium]
MDIGFDASNPLRPEQDAAAAVQHLRENQERLQLIQQAANIGIFEWNLQTGLVVGTKESEELFGLSPGSFAGTETAWEQTLHPDDLPASREKLFASIAQKTALDMQFRVIWPDQSVHWIYAKGRTFYDQQGQPLRILGINVDITERKNSEEKLHITEEKLRLFAESDVIGFVFSDVYGEISHANEAFLRLIGYSKSEFLERKIRWTDITPPEWLPVDQQHINEAQQKGKSSLYEKQYIQRDGSIVDVLIGYLLLGTQRDQAVAFILDITENKRLAREKDAFIEVISHELRTPLTSLKIFAQILHKRFDKSGESQNAQMLAKMSTQIDKLTKLIADLVDVTKIEVGKLALQKTTFDLMSLLREVSEEMQRTTTRHTTRIENGREHIICGDRDRIGQVLTNLVSNAIKYSPHADTILLKVSSEEKQVIVSVQDFGLGIPLDQQDQIFQRFYRVNEKALETISGLGLGLYISAEMIKRHGGRMWFESTPGCGSTFSFSIPLEEEKEST